MSANDFHELTDEEVAALKTPGIGHNAPPQALKPETIGERLAKTWGHVVTRLKDIQQRAAEVPATIEDDETAKAVGDLIKIAKTEVRAADAARKVEKEPYKAAADQVDGFFKTKSDEVTAVVRGLETKVSAWLQLKAQREARRRAEEAERLRQEAEARMREAEAAEARRLEAEAAALADRNTAATARLGKEAAIQLVRDARAKRDTQASIMRTAKVDGDTAAWSAAAKLKSEAEAEMVAAEARVQELRREEQEADARAREQAAAAKVEKRAVSDAVGAATVSERGADKFDRASGAKAADLSRTRGDLGSVASLRTDWVFDDMRRSELDLEKLRQHIPLSALEQAVRSWIDANKDGLKSGEASLRGVNIFADTKAVIR